MKKVAVLTDAMSAGHFFPLWHSYYGKRFGDRNLFVLTYDGATGSWQDFRLGSLWQIGTRYNDDLRARTMSSWVTTLLSVYDVVIRCDVDEFLIPNPNQYPDLIDYVEKLGVDYVTARGVDVIEQFDDGELNYNKNILGEQRIKLVKSAALNKTCITKVPMHWAPGFHSTTVFPHLDNLYLFHMKFADIRGRTNWFNMMSNHSKIESSEAKYFSDGAGKLLRHQQWCLNKTPAPPESLANKKFDDEFISSVTHNKSNGIYPGDFAIDDQLIDLPSEFYGIV